MWREEGVVKIDKRLEDGRPVYELFGLNLFADNRGANEEFEQTGLHTEVVNALWPEHTLFVQLSALGPEQSKGSETTARLVKSVGCLVAFVPVLQFDGSWIGDQRVDGFAADTLAALTAGDAHAVRQIITRGYVRGGAAAFFLCHRGTVLSQIERAFEGQTTQQTLFARLFAFADAILVPSRGGSSLALFARDESIEPSLERIITVANQYVEMTDWFTRNREFLQWIPERGTWKG